MFRSLGKSKIAFVLAILFGLSLFFFRGGQRYSNLFNSDNVVASVSGTPISTSKFLRVMQMNVSQYGQMFGRPLTAEEIEAFQIHSMSLGALVNNAVFENEFDSKNFIIDEIIVASETKKRFPNLYNKNNKIDESALNSFLSKQNLKIDDLVKIIDYETRSKVFDKLFFQVDYPNKIKTVLSKYNNHTRNVDLIKLNINDFQLPNYNTLNISIENNQIIDFFDQNIKSYINPEKRDISYIVIDKNSFKDQFRPSNNEIENYYNANNNLFLESEKRDFIQFNFKDLKEATQFRNNVISYKNEEIIQFAKENNVFFNEFSKVSKNDVLEDLSKVIFGLQQNQISDIVETPLAKHLVIINSIYPQNQKTLDQSREEITNTLQEVELNSYMLDLKNKISQQILNGLSLNEIAKENTLIIETIKNTERKANQTENDLIKNEVIAKGFASNKDFVTDIVDIDDIRSIVINVDKVENEKPYKLSEVFELVSNDWIKSLKVKNIEEKIEETTNNKKSIEDIKRFVNTEITNTNIKINDNDYPSTLKNNVFTNKINQISLSIVSDDIYISEVIKISFPEEESEQTISMLSELRSNFGAEIIKNKNISTNDSLIQALIKQY